jgi:transposase
MAYIKSYPNQEYLIPPRINDLFSEDHVCYLIENIADSMDYSEFDEKYAGAGHPAYHPRISLKLLAMANVDGMRSSRTVAKNAHENVVYIYLAEKTKPDFRTISDFRRDNPEVIKNFMLQLNKFAHENDLIDLSQLMFDGTTIKANANNNRILDKSILKKLEKYIEREIQKGIEVDEEEDKLYGDRGMHELPKEFNNSEKRRPIVRKIVDEINKGIKKDKAEKIKKELEEIEKNMKDENLKKYSMTDPDSRFMLGKKGKVELYYNAQLVVDKNGLIISNDVVQDREDRHQLLPNVNRVEQDYGKLPKGTTLCTDGLYMSEDITELDQRGYDLLMPTYGMQKHETKKFDKLNFKYDEEKDNYICPEGKLLEFLSINKNKIYGQTITYKCGNCPSCHHQKECCKNKKYKTILALPHSKLANRIKTKMETPEGRAKYKIREQTVERSFGDIKYHKKFTHFLLRGIKKVKIEFNLACIGHNLVMINNLLKKNSISLATNY